MKLNRIFYKIVKMVSLLSLTLWCKGTSAVEPPNQRGVMDHAASSQSAVARTDILTPANVKARVAAYFDALEVNNWQTAYRMHLGALDGSLTPLEFMRPVVTGGLKVLSYVITDVTVNSDGETATVDVKATYELPQLFKPYTTSLRTQWMLRDGQIYRYTDKFPRNTDSAASPIPKQLQ